MERPADTLRVAFEAIRLVAQEQKSLDELHVKILILELSLRFGKALQKKWDPSKRIQDVLYCFWQCGRNRTQPVDAKPPELQFYQHGGLLALAALGLVVYSNKSKCADISVFDSLNRLASEQRIAVIESIKDYPRHHSIDEGLQQVPRYNCKISHYVQVLD
jgi:hypothetical protein